MDFIDQRTQKRKKIQLIIGYFLIMVALLLGTVILLFSAYGYGLGKNGQIIQNGLVFVSSTPSPAQIYLNGTLNAAATNSRLQLPSGQYTMELEKTGYRPWIRAVGVEGGSVEHFDYPFLFPTKLVTTNVDEYTSEPQLILQSPNKQWLLVQQTSDPTSYDEYNLTNGKQVVSTDTTITIPASILTNATTGSQSWQLVGWSNDNQHALLIHNYQGGSEYIILDRQTPSDSINLTKSLGLSATDQVTMINGKYDQYYIYDTASQKLGSETLSNPQLTPLLSDVLDYKSYGSNTIIYVTEDNAPTGKVNINVFQGSTTYRIRQEPEASNYLIDIAQYAGDWYVVADGSSDNKVYIYEDPMSDLSNNPTQVLVPIYILKLNQPTYESFSDNFQFIMAESGTNIAVYDAENEKAYDYTIKVPIDNDQPATWMDGDRLMVDSAGKLVVFDYDGANQQTLQSIEPGSLAYFDPPYKWVYNIAPITPSATSSTPTDTFALTSTALRIPADQ